MHLYLSGAFGIYKHVGLCVRPPPVSNENEFFNDCAYGRYASGFPRWLPHVTGHYRIFYIFTAMKYVLIVSLVLLGFNCVMSKDGDSKKESVGTVIGIDLGTTYSWLVQ